MRTVRLTNADVITLSKASKCAPAPLINGVCKKLLAVETRCRAAAGLWRVTFCLLNDAEMPVADHNCHVLPQNLASSYLAHARLRAFVVECCAWFAWQLFYLCNVSFSPVALRLFSCFHPNFFRDNSGIIMRRISDKAPTDNVRLW